MTTNNLTEEVYWKVQCYDKGGEFVVSIMRRRGSDVVAGWSIRILERPKLVS